MPVFETLKEGLLCSVCAEIYKDPFNVKNCLHKFCANCIEDYNRIYKKECPACRAQIGSRRHLRRDYRLRDIIESLVKDVSLFNRYEQIIRQ